MTAADISVRGLTAASPKIVWIELTSKCPFDCVFCTRKFDRGSGRHMSFELYRSLVGQLVEPEIIRLNYSGESIHYPRLGEAIGLARSTGATTELVSAFSSATSQVVRSLVDAGLSRLSISVHTTDTAQYRDLYRFGSLEALFERIAELREYQSERGSNSPEIDFAFVAMRRNLAELRPVVKRAGSLGIRQVSVHPVIRRRPTVERFPGELNSSGELLPEFESLVLAEAAAAARETPGVEVSVARPRPATAVPGMGIPTCEQNPWETVHILADGAAVVCEVQDLIKVGDLTRESLADIWHGAAYEAFREQYACGGNSICRACAWRQSAPVLDSGVVLFRGWHPSTRESVKWSQNESCVLVNRRQWKGRLQISGVLPPGPAGSKNELTVKGGTGPVRRIENPQGSVRHFDLDIPLSPSRSGWDVVTMRTRYSYCPAEAGSGPDLRRLGFGLVGIRGESSRRRTIQRLLGTLRRIDSLRGLPLRFPLKTGFERIGRTPGVSILIPERNSPQLLARCLETAEQARRETGEPVQVLVVVSGSEPQQYETLRREFRQVEWSFRAAVLPFRAAVAHGLARVCHPWVYLLNNDMVLQPNAICEVLRYRTPDTFAVGSRIEMDDGTASETNWTDLRFPDGDAVELIELDSGAAAGARGCLYAGGGSALFQAGLLRQLARRTRAYDPFYWEDAEWGATAWRHGYRSVYCPSSRVNHAGRRTIGRFYAPSEIERIFQRNRLLFHLRNMDDVGQVGERLLALDTATWSEIFRLGTVTEILRVRLERAFAPRGDESLHERWRLRFDEPISHP